MNKPLPKRPKGSVFNWSHAQGVTWIRKSVRAGAVKFSSHAFQREAERNVSHEEALECILKGSPFDWEEGINPQTKKADRRMSFKQQLRTKIIRVVTVVDDEENLVIVATVIKPKY